MDLLNELAQQLDELSNELLETDPNPHSLTYFDYIWLSHEYDQYMVRAILLSTQIRPSCESELDEFWKLRGHGWNPVTRSYERVLPI